MYGRLYNRANKVGLSGRRAPQYRTISNLHEIRSRCVDNPLNVFYSLNLSRSTLPFLSASPRIKEHLPLLLVFLTEMYKHVAFVHLGTIHICLLSHVDMQSSITFLYPFRDIIDYSDFSIEVWLRRQRSDSR